VLKYLPFKYSSYSTLFIFFVFQCSTLKLSNNRIETAGKNDNAPPGSPGSNRYSLSRVALMLPSLQITRNLLSNKPEMENPQPIAKIE